MAWNENSRRRRSSAKKLSTLCCRRRKPPAPTSRAMAPGLLSRSKGVRKSRSMKLANSMRYSSVTHRTKRSKPAASFGPAAARTSSAMAVRSARTRISEPSQKQAR
jgi:hypothetical protein